MVILVGFVQARFVCTPKGVMDLRAIRWGQLELVALRRAFQQGDLSTIHYRGQRGLYVHYLALRRGL